jgi:hypothetical protein
LFICSFLPIDFFGLFVWLVGWLVDWFFVVVVYFQGLLGFFWFYFVLFVVAALFYHCELVNTKLHPNQ